MLGDLFTKLQEARTKIDEAKKQLNSIVIEYASPDGKIKVKANANKMITSIEITPSLLQQENKEELEETLLVTINRALEEAAQKGEAEMKNITKDLIPDFPGLV